MNERQGSIEMEKTYEPTGVYIGRLKDLGLGNPDGIPSRLASRSDSELQEIARQKAESLVPVEDPLTPSCIDGRHCKCNADGTAVPTRYRRVGATASDFGVAMNAESTVLETIPEDSTLGHSIHMVNEAIGYNRAAHLGNCGGANGEVGDDEAINQNPNIINATKSLMSIPEVEEYLETDYTDEAGQRVVAAAGKTAQYFDAMGWDGQKYVDGVVDENPNGVEDLEVDENDPTFHGHREDALAIVLGELTLYEDDIFVWNLETTKYVASKLSGQRGAEGYRQAVVAEIAKHIAVAKRLPSEETPVFLLIGRETK